MALLDRVIFNPSGDGSGDFVFASVVAGYQDPASAGAVDGTTYSYAAENRTHAGKIIEWEVGRGTWTAATSTLSRTTVLFSSNNGSKVNFSDVPQVMITALAEDLDFGSVPTTYYVDGTNGNDSHPGSIGAPIKTIGKVNGLKLNPGDSVLFAAGQTFSGAIVCPSSGQPGNPITFGSYGGGRATISSGAGQGFFSHNQAGIVVRDLIFTGSTPSSNQNGINFFNDSAGNIHFQNIQVINCTVSGYGGSGIWVLGGAGSSGYDDVLIQGCTVSSCCKNSNSGVGTAGIYVSSDAGLGLGSFAASFNNVIIDNCSVSGCLGATDSNWTGSGIVISETNLGVIRNCEANGNGGSSNSSLGNGPVGIWTADSTNVLIDNCRSINNSTANNGDGGGFDLDIGCVDCEISNCYSEGNFGPGYLIASVTATGYTGNNNCRLTNCVSYNDVTGGASAIFPYAFAILSTSVASVLTNFKITNCSCYIVGKAVGFAGSNASNITGSIVNSRFAASGTQTIITSKPSGVTLVGTDAYQNSNDLIVFDSNGTNILDFNISHPNIWTTPNTTAGFVSPFYSSIGTSGAFSGVYISLIGDSQNRIQFGLDGNDRPIAAFGAGGASVPDIGSWRNGAHNFAISAGNLFAGNASSPAALQVFNIIDTVGNPTNYERGVFDWTTTTNVLTIGTQKGGSGSARPVVVSVNAIEQIRFTPNAGGIHVGIGGTPDFSGWGASPTVYTIYGQIDSSPAFDFPVFEMVSRTGDGSGSVVAFWDFAQASNSATYQEVVQIVAKTEGATASQRGGSLFFQTQPNAVAGSIQRLNLTSQGNIVLGNAAISTSATDGFLYIPTCAGAPSGTPTTYTGRVAIVWDTTNHKFWVYDGAWKGGTNPGVWT